MAKSIERMKARVLRRKGESIKKIARLLGVSKSTVSIWCNDIRLSQHQIAILNERRVTGGYQGRMIGAHMNREKRLKRISFYEQEGMRQMKNVNDGELLIFGLGLHLGEGGKKRNEFQLVNSSPDVIRIVLLWLEKIFHVPRKEIRCRVSINSIHAPRVDLVVRKWSRITGIPISQFNRTVLIHAKSKKIYENYDSYLGNLVIRVNKSSELQYRILGLIKGIVYKLNRMK